MTTHAVARLHNAPAPVARADRAVASAIEALVAALRALVRVSVELEVIQRGNERPQVWAYVEGDPWRMFEPEYYADVFLRRRSEQVAAEQAFGGDATGDWAVYEFNRLLRTLVALGGADALRGRDGVLRIDPVTAVPVRRVA